MALPRGGAWRWRTSQRLLRNWFQNATLTDPYPRPPFAPAPLGPFHAGRLSLAGLSQRGAAAPAYRPPMSMTEEQSLRKLWELLQRAQAWEDRIDAGGPEAAQVQPGSALAEDDALTEPYHLSHSAWHALVVAVDHTRCLRWALNGEERGGLVPFRLGTHSPGTILRCAIENGARAVWLLAPGQRSTRVARRIALERYEYQQAKRLWALLRRGAAAEEAQVQQDEAHDKQVEGLAQAAHLQSPDARSARNFPGYGALIREAGGDPAMAAWNGCSSLAHGATRGANMLTRETVDVVAGVENMRLTGLSIRLLSLLTWQAVAVIDRGFTRYEQLARAAPPPAVEAGPAPT
jgi:hypothetical protein